MSKEFGASTTFVPQIIPGNKRRAILSGPLRWASEFQPTEPESGTRAFGWPPASFQNISSLWSAIRGMVGTRLVPQPCGKILGRFLVGVLLWWWEFRSKASRTPILGACLGGISGLIIPMSLGSPRGVLSHPSWQQSSRKAGFSLDFFVVVVIWP